MIPTAAGKHLPAGAALHAKAPVPPPRSLPPLRPRRTSPASRTSDVLHMSSSFSILPACLDSRIWRVAAASLLCALFLAPRAAQGQVDFRGYVEEAIGVRVGVKDDVIYHRQTLNTKFSGELRDDIKWWVSTDTWHDSPDFLPDDEFRFRVREAYAKMEFDAFDLRVGRVQIAWGEADGAIISDQISPFDFTNFIIPPFDAIRLGVDGVFLDYYFDNGDDLQVLWISHFQEPDFPDTRSPWAFIDFDEFAQAGISLASSEKPADTLKNSEGGIRYSGHPLWADWSIGYFHSWDDRPAPRILAGALTPTYEQFELFSANIAYPVKDYLIRMDSAYELGRFLSTDPVRAFETAADGFVSRHDVWKTMLAVDLKPDFEWWHQADATIQYVREQVVDPRPGLNQAVTTNLFSVLLRAAYLNETVKPWVFWIWDARGSNSWMQLKVDYEPIDQWRFSLEYDRFTGHTFDLDTNSGGLFGSFADNDMMQATLRRSF